MAITPSPQTPSTPSSPPYFPDSPANDSPDNQTISSGSPSPIAASGTSFKYSVASHSVRITKYGYAINPVELRYPEIINNLPPGSRRLSRVSFSPDQVGHMVLSLIRGFWSQPAFPKGQTVKLDKELDLSAILEEFSQSPLYPHTRTLGGMAGERIRRAPKSKSMSKRSKRLITKLNSNQPNSVAAQLGAQSPSPSSDANDILGKSIRDTFQNIPSPVSSPSALNNNNIAPTSPSLRTSKRTGSTESSNIFSMFVSKSSSKSRTAPKQTDTYHSWIPRDSKQLYELLTSLCKQMEKLFSNESRILKLPSPCTVLGDIHGNLTDLRTYERSLWPRAPVCVSNNYLFLGDYVDRGDYSIECVIYLFSLKLIAPHRFFMLRGNHEVAAIQRQYTFSKECELKFGSTNGRHLWKSFNKVFDVMPIAAVIDKQIFCAHGGIPRSISDLDILAKEIPTPLDNPEVQCPSAWEILWNDPITDSELIGMIEMDNAVVTQTQITQTQPTPDGKNIVTETTTSTTITTDSPTTKGANTNSSASTLTGPDAILSREPEAALSYYIRPDVQQQQQSEDKRPDSDKKNESDEKKDEESALRKVPSDTSSIASTSPQQIINDGFVSNIKRGTAFLFSDQAINHFLKVNNLSHVIRAHEVIPTGFAFHGDGRVITIFSSSKYCGLNNQAACALVDQNRIRILRLDTGEAGE